MRFPNGDYGVATGTMIGADYVITCAHALFQKKLGGWARNIRFTPALNGRVEPYGGAVAAAEAFVPEEFQLLSPPQPVRVKNPTEYVWDFGLVRLERDIDPSGRQLFPALVPLGDPALNGAAADLAGYPRDKPAGELWNGSGPLMRPDEHLLFYRISTDQGQSGSSVRLPGGVLGTPRIVGIHVAGLEEDANFAVRVTTAVVDHVMGWMAGSATAETGRIGQSGGR